MPRAWVAAGHDVPLAQATGSVDSEPGRPGAQATGAARTGGAMDRRTTMKVVAEAVVDGLATPKS